MQKQQNTTEFSPDIEHLVFANFYIQTYGNIREAFELMGRDRTIYYQKWRYQEGFSDWLSEFARKEVLKHVGKWFLLLEKFAEKGSFNHLDRLLQIAEEFIPKPETLNNINVYPNRTIVFRDIGPEDLRTENITEEECSDDKGMEIS